MPSGVKDIQLLELKDTISQLNKTISTQNELISSLQKMLEERNAKDSEKTFWSRISSLSLRILRTRSLAQPVKYAMTSWTDSWICSVHPSVMKSLRKWSNRKWSASRGIPKSGNPRQPMMTSITLCAPFVNIFLRI